MEYKNDTSQSLLDNGPHVQKKKKKSIYNFWFPIKPAEWKSKINDPLWHLKIIITNGVNHLEVVQEGQEGASLCKRVYTIFRCKTW